MHLMQQEKKRKREIIKLLSILYNETISFKILLTAQENKTAKKTLIINLYFKL